MPLEAVIEMPGASSVPKRKIIFRPPRLNTAVAEITTRGDPRRRQAGFDDGNFISHFEYTLAPDAPLARTLKGNSLRKGAERREGEERKGKRVRGIEETRRWNTCARSRERVHIAGKIA